MLVLTRKPGQGIMIGDGVEIQVLSVGGGKVRLGITAPRDVGIFRDEVYERIDNERQAPDTEDEDPKGEKLKGGEPSEERPAAVQRA
jgi:carbon storage regulator